MDDFFGLFLATGHPVFYLLYREELQQKEKEKTA